MADIIVSITIPEGYAGKVLNAFNKVAGTHLGIESDNMENNFHCRWDFQINPKAPSETNIQFGQRVFREFGKAIINMVDKAEDDIRYRNEIAAITAPHSDVPNNILE